MLWNQTFISIIVETSDKVIYDFLSNFQKFFWCLCQQLLTKSLVPLATSDQDFPKSIPSLKVVPHNFFSKFDTRPLTKFIFKK